MGFLLAQAHMSARKRADEALAGVGLDMKGFAALATLASSGPTSQRKLSELIRMDPATMVDVIDSLEAKKHLERRRNPDDRREYALHLTARGRALFDRAEKAILEAEKQSLGDLQPAQVRTLMGLLEKIQ
ncbi:MAG TPA: MarR family transcriptional regulator [Candidatus Dormibacteraeota bacterium]